MSTADASPNPVEPKQPSGIRAALRYTGIPVHWLDKRPKLPSRNWLIFLSVTSCITGYYIYDRRQCRRIKQHYIDLVKDQADQAVDPLAWPRKVTVYGAKWPGDEEYQQATKYFRKYVKPILVAAAVDFELVSGKRFGDVAEHVAEDVRKRRRIDHGIDPIPEVAKALPTYKSPEEVAKHKLQGGIVIVGRPTLKEFMAGLSKGWTDPLDNVDREDALARELEFDSAFDEVDEPTTDDASPSSGSQVRFPTVQNSPLFSPLQLRPPPSSSKTKSSIPDTINAPPDVIPQVPPLLLVPFINHIGLSQIPLMIWEWFNQRHKVRSGSEAGYRLVMSQSRPIIPPPDEPTVKFSDITTPVDIPQGDLGFDKEAESWYKTSLSKFSSDIEDARHKYYEQLPKRLATARELARGTREATKEEIDNPPPTEVELRAERIKKELRWRGDLAGWDIVKPQQKVVWDSRFSDALRIFTDRT
ncbi:hypothetical protein H0H93_011707 [Arthromyces matolae]|nr:hypothetical protein H0H93_011707 [Arthromyces matolae]